MKRKNLIILLITAVMLALTACSPSDIIDSEDYIPQRVKIDDFTTLSIEDLSTSFNVFEFDNNTYSLYAYSYLNKEVIGTKYDVNTISGEYVKSLYEVSFCETYQVFYMVFSIFDEFDNLINVDYISITPIYFDDCNIDAIMIIEGKEVYLSEFFSDEVQECFFTISFIAIFTIAKITAVLVTAVKAAAIITIVVGGIIFINQIIRDLNSIRNDSRARILTASLASQLEPGYYPAAIRGSDILIIPYQLRNKELAVATFSSMGREGGIFSPSRSAARQVARDAGRGRTPIAEGNKIGYFQHYHAFNRDPEGHAWFGLML